MGRELARDRHKRVPAVLSPAPLHGDSSRPGPAGQHPHLHVRAAPRFTTLL